MTALSRREFLQALGISAASAALFGISVDGYSALAAPPAAPLQGRTLRPTALYAQPNLQTQTVNLWPDHLLTIRDHSADFYATEGGYVPRQHVQPMQPNITTTVIDTLPAHAEVIAPAAAVRTYADPRAPFITQIGHGGVMLIVDRIENGLGVWYETAYANKIPLGWTQAVHWRGLPQATHRRRLHIMIAGHTLTTYDGHNALFSTPVALPADLPAGDYILHRGAIGGTAAFVADDAYQGVPYTFKLCNGVPMHGAYWHNTFDATYQPQAVELNVVAARWLHDQISESTTLTVT
jgi:hypothetical protein